MAKRFLELGIEITAPRLYPEYAPDYHAFFFSDPDGARLEITNFRAERRTRMEHWDDTVLSQNAIDTFRRPRDGGNSSAGRRDVRVAAPKR